VQLILSADGALGFPELQKGFQENLLLEDDIELILPLNEKFYFAGRVFYSNSALI
jgi:hypothetical protein